MTAAKLDKLVSFLPFFSLNFAAREKQKQRKHNSEESSEGQTAANIG